MSFTTAATQTAATARTAAAATAAAATRRNIVLESFHLGQEPFRTFDPFLFYAHHNDQFPAGQDNLGPAPHLLRGRNIGSDFSFKDGWSMYHGDTIPGFPEHPHRGFETVTLATHGLVDHSDSLHCTARYGNGDTQWLTAGKGIQHAEMFPLLRRDAPNPLNLSQLWLNLPRKHKFCEPYFTMYWDEETPRAFLPDETNNNNNNNDSNNNNDKDKVAVVRVVAGEVRGVKPLPPPPHSWAADPTSDVAIWEMQIPRDVTITLPPAKLGAAVNRALYILEGKELRIEGEAAPVSVRTGLRVAGEAPLTLQALGAHAQVVLVQGRPIGEPVVKHGPFVMNTREEIMQCFADFRATAFGGWPWDRSDHAHARGVTRHALHPDGVTRYPPQKTQADGKNSNNNTPSATL